MLPEVDRLRDIYERSFKEHGDTALGFGWRDTKGQYERLKIISETVQNDLPTDGVFEVPTVLDVGCGAGALLDVIGAVNYVGIDMVPDMIGRAKDRWIDLRMFPTRFILDDFLTVPAFPDTYDYVVCSGAMNFLPEPVQFRYVSKMCLVAKRMVALNAQKVSIQTAQVWAGYFGVKEFQIRVGYLPDDITVTFWK